MARAPTFGPRFVVPSYLVKVRGEHGCMMTGNPASAAAQVACYLESRPGGACDVTYSEHCAYCGGNGRIAGKRRLSWQPCKRCKGEPDLFEYTFTPEETADMMRRFQSAWLAA